MNHELADAQAFKRLFDSNRDGQAVLARLVAKFSRNAYVRGGEEASRETHVRLGENNVIHFILGQIDAADSPEVERNDD